MIPQDLSPLWISLRAALLATFLAVSAGIWAGQAVARLRRGKGMADGLLSLPLVLPPTVVGFVLLQALGRNSTFGQWLSTMGITLIFSWPATVLSAAIVAFPLMYRTVRGAFEQLDPLLVPAARTLGLSEHTIFWRIILPNCAPGILAGTILSFARAMGEFGATIMIAGNIPGRTQTLPMAIYSAVQAGDRGLAGFWSLVMIILSLTALLAMNSWKTLWKGGEQV